MDIPINILLRLWLGHILAKMEANMDLGDVKVKDLGKVAVESVKDVSKDMLDMAEDKLRKLRKKMEDNM